MNKRFISVISIAAMIISISGCGSAQSSNSAKETTMSNETNVAATTSKAESSADTASTQIAKENETKSAESSASSDYETAPKLSGKYTIGLVIDNNSDQFNHEEGEAMKKMASDYKDAEITVTVMDGQGDVMKQNQCIEDLVNKKVNMIMIIPIDAHGNVPAIQEATAAGIPVVTLDATVDTDDKNVFYVGASDYNAGKAQAEYLASVLPKDAQILLIKGQEGMSNAQHRRDGAIETIGKLRPDVKLLAEQPGDWDEAKCMNIVEDWCQAYPKFDAIVCGGDSMALGAEEALEQANRLDGVYITGVDCIEKIVALIKEGKVSMSAQHTALMCAEKGFNYGLHVLNGENPEDYIWDYVAVTKDNVNQLYPNK